MITAGGPLSSRCKCVAAQDRNLEALEVACPDQAHIVQIVLSPPCRIHNGVGFEGYHNPELSDTRLQTRDVLIEVVIALHEVHGDLPHVMWKLACPLQELPVECSCNACRVEQTFILGDHVGHMVDERLLADAWQQCDTI